MHSTDVFISHAGPDKLHIARPLFEKLQAHGLNCFLDKISMEPGDCGGDEMTKAMESAKVGVFILSPEFAARKWTMRELRCFLRRRSEAIGSGMRPPTLIPVFYRLNIRECRELEPNRYWDGEGKNIFEVEKFFSEERQCEASTDTVKGELQELAGITGIENDERATNLPGDAFGHLARANLVERVFLWVKKKSEEDSSDEVREVLNASGCTHDVFRPCILAEHNPEEIYLQLNSRGIDGSPNTCEARLKEAVLSTDRNTSIGATATGKGGVGKTCALRAIAHDDDIKAQFSGGVYFMSLGKDANVGRLIEQLCMAIKASGGKQVAAEMREQSELSRVLTEMRAWFNTRVCLFIIDDVWAVNGIDACILQKLSTLAAATGDIRERSRLLYSTRDPELKQVGKRVTFEPREREGSDSVHMLMLASGANPEEANDPRCKEAVSKILKLCAGLPLALNVAGTGVRYMRDRWEGEKSQAWEAYLSKMKSRNTIRSESPGDGYLLSLDATLHASLEIVESGIGSDAERLGSVQRILEEIEEHAPRPWLQPVSECVGRAGGSLVEQIVLPSTAHEVGMDSTGGVYGHYSNLGDTRITVFTQSPDKETKMTELGNDFETGSRKLTCGCVSMSKRYAVIGYGDGTLQFWSVSEKKILWTICGHESWVCSVAMSGDGKRAVSGSWDRSVRVWDVDTGLQIGDALTGHTGGVYSVAMSGDGKRAVSGSHDKSVRVWDVDTGLQIGDALTGHTGVVYSVAMSGDGKRAVSGSYDKSVRIWDVDTGLQIGDALTGHTDGVASVGMSGDGKRAVSRSSDGGVRVWDVEKGSSVHLGKLKDWRDIVERFLNAEDVSRTGHRRKRRNVFESGGKIVHEREDGSEAVLVQLESTVTWWEVDDNHGVFVAAAGNRVAIMKLVV
ncbi:WD40-repeat containing protein [Chondrus crispus]|uniref:WD40-repeat containing protein n=1 Tax=Chondrus crispus TaxID=2769 RepID=R7QN84_CHOCR|nr:WD40-repeat containing protein [Chondrus crispus]CDF38850.1 WD40-repeat containing protein [Chondrus crispus]|eukprot:XP_005718755.1 WD40-repeat containing protein [Chondrus crispus]